LKPLSRALCICCRYDGPGVPPMDCGLFFFAAVLRSALAFALAFALGLVLGLRPGVAMPIGLVKQALLWSTISGDSIGELPSTPIGELNSCARSPGAAVTLSASAAWLPEPQVNGARRRLEIAEAAPFPGVHGNHAVGGLPRRGNCSGDGGLPRRNRDPPFFTRPLPAELLPLFELFSVLELVMSPRKTRWRQGVRSWLGVSPEAGASQMDALPVAM
jgi:hypothetical protein